MKQWYVPTLEQKWLHLIFWEQVYTVLSRANWGIVTENFHDIKTLPFPLLNSQTLTQRWNSTIFTKTLSQGPARKTEGSMRDIPSQEIMMPRGACGPARNFPYILCWVISRVWVEEDLRCEDSRHLSETSWFFFFSPQGAWPQLFTQTPSRPSSCW